MIIGVTASSRRKNDQVLAMGVAKQAATDLT